MSVVWGIVLGVGALLIASPVLWPATEARARRFSPASRMRERLAQAGLPRVTPTAILVASLVLGIASAAVVLALFPLVAVAAAVGVCGLALPWLLVTSRAKANRRASRVIWPDVVDHLVSAVRSGVALPESVVMLASTGPPPMRSAFADFEQNYRRSGSFAESLDRLKERLADPVADRIIETLRMSREVGGSELTTVLRNLASYLRQDAAIRSEVEARQSWVINAARLGVAAPWVVLVLLATRPEAAAAYNSAEGITLIVVGLALSIVAYRVMRGMGRLPEDRRWFG